MSEETQQPVTYEMLAKALFENYESIYDVDMQTNAYNVFHESSSYRQLNLTSHGDDFFKAMRSEVASVIAAQDQQHVFKRLSKEALAEGVRNNRVYSFVYRINRDGQQVFHQLRAVAQPIGDSDHVLIGVRDVNSLIRQQLAYRDEIDARRQKERNYLKAILDASAAYIDVNLTTDEILERSSNRDEGVPPSLKAALVDHPTSSYSELQSMICEEFVCDNKDRYRTVCSRAYLLGCFERGERRASVEFTVEDGADEQPFREVFYLYRENTTGDFRALCVVYDLTQQQKKDREIRQLNYELHLSRIRNSTSQMKPHFLYNVLGSIQEILLEDPVYASELLENFTFYLRGCIKAMDSDRPVSFSQEIENIKAYANIEKMRFGDRLAIHYDLEEVDFPILPLSVQPLVENAIRHGIYQRKLEGGSVNIRSWAERDYWIVQVEDTGVGFDIEDFEHRLRHAETDSSGLKNIRFRLEKVMGASLKMESAIGKGTTATIRIPRKGTEHASNHS